MDLKLSTNSTVRGSSRLATLTATPGGETMSEPTDEKTLEVFNSLLGTYPNLSFEDAGAIAVSTVRLIRQAAADATRVERERCAKIAEFSTWAVRDYERLGYYAPRSAIAHSGADERGTQIANAIRAEPDAGDAA